jgi:hypothetical protein
VLLAPRLSARPGIVSGMTRPAPRTPRTTLTARTPEDVLAAVPVVLGFEPRESVVMLTFGGRETFHARVDLPPPREALAVAELLREPAVRHGVTRVLLVLYCAAGPAHRAVVRAMRRVLGEAGIEVVEVLRAHDGRWWTSGGPARGTPYDAGGHRFRAQAVVDGLVVHGSRDDLVALLRARAPAVAEVRAALASATPSSPAEIGDLVELRLPEGALRTAELARVLLGLRDPGGRDAAWAAMDRPTSPGHVRLWTDAVQRSPDDLVPAPAAVLGLAAWLAGQGALAWCAVDRCRAVDPGNTLAGLVADILAHAVPPGAFATALRREAG